MNLVDRIFAKRLDEATKQAENRILKTVTETLQKSTFDGISPTPTGVKRYSFDPTWFNANQQQRKKPGGSISYDTLRRFSESHEVSRACINFRKDQIAGLEWDIVATDTEDTNTYDNEVLEIKQWFRTLGGPGMNYRKFMHKVIEDLLVLDAISLYRQKTYGGGLYTLIPLDASTIRLLVDESGATPLPPDAAYRQYIRGQLVEKFTTDELLYDMLNPRTNTPYGLAPLESLVVTVSSSLKAGMYNLGYLTDGNIPEGLMSVPENWTPQMIQQFQANFDAALAGDEAATSRLKIVPGGTYTPTKKRDDMQFAEFNEWLMKVTCSLFKVPPNEIGFPPKSGLGGKGFSEQQEDNGTKKGMKPLVQFFRELFDGIIADEFGKPYLRFEFKGIDDKDAKAEAEANEVLIRSGQRTINEIRTDEGIDPIEGLDKPIFAGTFQFIDPESMQQKQEQAQQAAQAQADALAQGQSGGSQNDKTDNADKAAVVDDLRKYKRYALGRLKDGKSLRKFESKAIAPEIVTEINERLNKSDLIAARQIFDSYIRDAHQHISKATRRNEPLEALAKTPEFSKFQRSIYLAVRNQYKYFLDNMPTDLEANDMSKWLDDNLPTISKSLDPQDVYDYYKYSFMWGIKSQYERFGLGIGKQAAKAADATAISEDGIVDGAVSNFAWSYDGTSATFNLTNPYYLQALHDTANSLLNFSPLDNTTKAQIIRVVNDGREAGMTIQEVADQIREQYEDISQSRAMTIARTESANTLGQGNYAALVKNDVPTKSWVTAGRAPCEICIMNSGDGDVPIDKAFSSGDMNEPAHPNDECYVEGGEIDLSTIDIWSGQ